MTGGQAILLLVLSAGFAAPLAAQEPPAAAERADAPMVRSIRVEGNRRVTSEQVLRNLRTRVDQPLDRQDVAQDIRDLYARYGVRAAFREERRGDGIALVIDVDEEMLIEEIDVRGVPDARARELLEEVSLQGVRSMLESQVRERAVELEQRLRDEGRYFATVGLALETRDGVRVAVLDVHEGEKVEVDAIEIEGDLSLDHDRVTKVMSTRPTRFLVFKNYLRKDALERDLVEIQRYLQAEGFRDATVELGEVALDEDGDEATVFIRVQEGPRYTVSAVELETEGDAVPRAALEELLAMVPGDAARAADVERDRRALLDAFAERGHVRATVETQVLYAEEGTSVRIVHRAAAGPQKRVRDVLIRGNATTKDEVVRREITLAPGDLADAREVRRSAERLRALGYFRDERGRDLVDLRFQSTPDPLLEDLLVDVEETRSGRLFFTAGASTDVGFFAGVNLEKKNFDIHDAPSSWDPVTLFSEFWNNEAFHGGGQSLSIQVQPGSRVSNYRLTFTEPYLGGPDRHPWSLQTDLYAVTSRIFDEFRQVDYGVAATFLKSIDDHWAAGPFARVELVDVGDLDDAPDDVEDVEGTNFVPSIGGIVRYREFDRLIAPTEGYEVGGRYELLGVDAFGQRVVLSGTKLMPLHEDERGRRHVLAMRGATGFADGFSGELPFFERLNAGGISGDFPLRGFDTHGVGPESKDVHLGGRYAYAGTLEYQFPLYSSYEPLLDEEDEIVRGVTFLDFGSVEDGLGSLVGRPRASVGAGVRVKLPFLGDAPVSVDLALPFLKESDDETEYFSIRVATRF